MPVVLGGEGVPITDDWAVWPATRSVAGENTGSAAEYGLEDYTTVKADQDVYRLWSEEDGSVTSVSNSDFALLSGLYRQRLSTEVRRYLTLRRPLVMLLFRAYQEVRKCFPSNRLSLELVEDPDDPEFEQLVLGIFSEDPVADTLARLERLDQEWWLDVDVPENSDLCITTIYV